jgi:Cof subfamily protein (haloacid dehalogenase superfamily)
MVAIDIDGTIAELDGSIQKTTIDAIRSAHMLGQQIALVSARPPQGIDVTAGALGISVYRIAYLGAVIQDMSQHQLRRLTIDLEVARDIARFADTSNLSITLTIDDVEYHTRGESRPSMIPSETVHSAEKKLREANPPVLIGVVGHDGASILAEYCKSKFGDVLHVVRHVNVGGSYASTVIVSKEADKGRALATLCQEINVDLHSVLAIGDSESDVAMFNVVGCSVAVKNSDTAAKDAAHFTAPWPCGAGVAWAIRTFAEVAPDNPAELNYV